MNLNQSLQTRLVVDQVAAEIEEFFNSRDREGLRTYLSVTLSDLLEILFQKDELIKDLMYEKIWRGFDESPGFVKPVIEN